MPQLTDIGRIGRDTEVRFTPGGDAVANLAIACEYGRKGQDGKRPTQWVDATLWGKQAEAMAPYLVKGQQVYFTIDDAHIETYKKSDGTDGVKLTGKVIIIKFAGAPPGSEARKPQAQRPAPQQRQAPQQQAQQPASDFDSFDDDLPF